MTTPQMAPDRRSMRVSEWPPNDREIWRAALVAGDLLDEGGARAGHAEQSNAMVAAGYGYWLTWLAQQGLLDADRTPADRVQGDYVTRWVAEMQHRGLASNTIATRLQALYAVAGLLDDGKDWGWIRRIESRLRARHAPVRRKRERMVGAADLLSLGRTLMAEAPAQSTDRLRAMQYRDGLMIAFLAARPLRLRNLSALELDRTVARRGDGWWIAIPSEETKTHAAIEVPWPEALTAPLTTYLTEQRPILCSLRNRWTRPVGSALWVSTHGSPMGYFAIADTIARRTGAAFGKPINPHLFRDCAATSIAIDDPQHVWVASQILGHRSATTERYYNQARTIDAARRYQDFLVALRNGTIIEDTEPA